jgi:hypothetical protein
MIDPSSGRPPNRRADTLALLALTALIALFFWKMIFTSLIVARGDLFTYFYPYREYAASALRQGRLPLWNPYLFMGAPLIANSQVGFFYPFNLLTSWLEVTRAVNLNIVAHVWIASVGAYVFARRRLGASILAAWLGGVSFGLGGYLGAQVEHFNQLQALAWLPWLWLAYESAAGVTQARGRVSGGLLVGLIVALMLLAGHTQSVFIALVGLIAYALWPAIEQFRAPRDSIRTAIARLVPIAIGIVAAVALAAVQLLPTTELAGYSPRGGGLSPNEAVSFSLDPRLIGRTLLPDYEGALPSGSEFSAFVGVSALMLMVVGAWAGRRSRRAGVRAMTALAALGLFLAPGGFNPIYYALVDFVPGFDLFRAPARWLALFAFAGSMLAAIGLDGSTGSNGKSNREDAKNAKFSESSRPSRLCGEAVSRPSRKSRLDLAGRRFTRIARMNILLTILIVALVASSYLGTDDTPAGAAGPIGQPGVASLLLWIAAAIATLALTRTFQTPSSNPTPLRFGGHGLQLPLVLLCTLELFLATRGLPYHARLTAPDALTSLRPSVAQLLVGATGSPPARFLSISDIQFDPGDSAELESIYADQLPPDAYYDLIVAAKQKEIAAPNLPLYYRLPAVDGFDGGVLPLRNYLTFQRLLLPPDAIQPDGRLREQLESIPDARWLDLTNVKYVIADKVRDRWFGGVFFDLQFVTRLGPGEEAWTDQLPPLEANALGLVYSEPASDGALAEVEIVLADGSVERLPLGDEPIDQANGLSMTRLRWERAGRVAAVRVRGQAGVTLHGAALIDERSHTFHAFVLAQHGRFRLAHSGDVKVYQNVDVLPRAFIVPEARIADSDEAAIAIMQMPSFDPSKTVVIAGETTLALHPSSLILHPSLRFTHYSPEYISLEVTSDGDGYLVLADAWYPGWTATVDGRAAEILRADVLFRAVPIQAGSHRVEFRYQPQSFAVGAAISMAAWLIFGAAMAYRMIARISNWKH